MKTNLEKVLLGCLVGMFIAFGIVVARNIALNTQLDEAKARLEFNHQRLIYTQEELFKYEERSLEKLTEILQISLSETNSILVDSGENYVDNSPYTTGTSGAFYYTQILSGKWNDKNWNLVTVPGDIIDISEDVAPGKLIATIRRYESDVDRFTEFQTILAEK